MSEQTRLAELYSYGLLDAVRPVVLDDLTRLAARIFDTPMSTVTLVARNRQWFAGNTGVPGREGPRDIAFCARMIEHPRPLIVEDARTDERFQHWANVTGAPYIRFYAGVPLIGAGGHVLGSVCVLDREPRSIGDQQVAMLGELAAQAAEHLSAIRDRARHAVLTAELTRLARREQDLVATVSHELRTPVATIQGYLEMLTDLEELAPYHRVIEPIRRNGDRLVRMVDHLLAGARTDETTARPDGPVDLAAVVREAIAGCAPLAGGRGVPVTLTDDGPAYVLGERSALRQAVEHLLNNAILFSAAGSPVRVRVTGTGVEIADEGVGIPHEEMPYVFDRFFRGRHAQEQAVPGMGLGLSIATRIIGAHGGGLEMVCPGENSGTLARVSLPVTAPEAGRRPELTGAAGSLPG